MSPAMGEVIKQHKRLHHSQYVGWLDSGLPVIFCNRCGGFSTHRGSKELTDPRGCTRKTSSELRKLGKGMLPAMGRRGGAAVQRSCGRDRIPSFSHPRGGLQVEGPLHQSAGVTAQ
eukprot:1001123-Pyramimonas_sp.AAC.1